MLIAAAGSQTAAFLTIGVLGILVSASVYLAPGFYDRVTRARLRMLNLDENDQRTLDKDRQRRRLIALILSIFSLLILIQGLTHL
jgi:hypothetical protein